MEGSGEDNVVQYVSQYRPIVALFNHTSQCNRKLEVRKLFDAYIHSILKATTQQEECRRVLYTVISAYSTSTQRNAAYRIFVCLEARMHFLGQLYAIWARQSYC